MNIFFFGDSICFGQLISPHKTWVTKIAQELEKLPSGEKIRVINSSVNGNTTRMALERMPFDIQEYGIVDILLIQFGLNDCNYWETDHGHPRVSKMAFKANILEIIERARIFGCQKIFLNTNHPTLKTNLMKNTTFSFQQSNEEYNQIIREVAKNSRTRLIDIELFWQKGIKIDLSLKNLLLPDGLHLSAAGHNLYFEIVFPIIKKEKFKNFNMKPLSITHWDYRAKKVKNDMNINIMDIYQRNLEYEEIIPYLNEKDVVLEVGCGNGYSTSVFRKFVKHIDAFDCSKHMIARAKKAFGEVNNIRKKVGLANIEPAKINFYSKVNEVLFLLKQKFIIKKQMHLGSYDYLTRFVYPYLVSTNSMKHNTIFHKKAQSLADAYNPNFLKKFSRIRGFLLIKKHF